MVLNDRQKEIVEADDSKILCMAAAGSGKTRTLTERVRNIIEKKNTNPEDIVAISFTRLAAEEMKKRLGGIADGAFIGTVHSYANSICALNNVDTTQDLALFDFDAILEKASKIPSSNYPEIGHLLIDESQDLTAREFQFIQKIPTKNSFFIGDDRQNIYQFRGGTDQFVIDMSLDKSYKKYYLTENYRNAPNILSFAEDLIKTFRSVSPKVQPVKTQEGIVERMPFLEALEELEYSGNLGSWFILTRTNNELAKIQEKLNERDIPNLTFKKGDFDTLDELDKLIVQNKVKVLTCHSAKGLESKNVIVVGAKTYNEDERRLSYVAATRAENALYWCPALAGSRGDKGSYRRMPESTKGGDWARNVPMIEF